jgi:hypothetical protein
LSTGGSTKRFLNNFCCEGLVLYGSNFVSPCSLAEPGNRIHLCPLFNRLSWSDYGHHIGAVQDAYRLQLKLFLSEVRHQQLLSGIQSFLKLYTTISISKLASFMDVDGPTLRYA